MGTSSESTSPRHSIGVVSRRTGLKPDLIRAWERRYGAVEPARSDTRRRLYSDDEVRRLHLLSRAVDGGRNIGDIANLPEEELEELIAGDAAATASAPRRPAPAPWSGEEGRQAGGVLEACLAAVHRLDARALERELERASVALSRTHLIEQVLEPLMHRIGDLWKEGSLRPVHEHLASAVVRSFVAGLGEAYEVTESSPRIVITTPARQRHELGALLASAGAAAEGWEVLYLGPDLPVEEIAAGVREAGARAVGLSITFPPDDPAIPGELTRLRRLLPEGTALLVGGRSAPAYREAVEEAGGRVVETVAELRDVLAELRTLG